jgi:CBS domain-containing protein
VVARARSGLPFVAIRQSKYSADSVSRQKQRRRKTPLKRWGVLCRHDEGKLIGALEEVSLNVESLMTEPPVYIEGNARSHEAKSLADARNIHYLLVVDADEDLIGITCLCDVARAGVDDPVGSFAHKSITYVSAGEDAAKAAEIMQDCAVGCLPVIRAPGNVIGVVTRHDLIQRGLLDSVPRCAACGTTHDLPEQAEGARFCRACIEATPKPGTIARRWYCTLGDGD